MGELWATRKLSGYGGGISPGKSAYRKLSHYSCAAPRLSVEFARDGNARLAEGMGHLRFAQARSVVLEGELLF